MRLGHGVYVRTPHAHIGPVRFHPHMGTRSHRRPPRTDRVRRVGQRPPRHVVRRALVWSVVIVPAAVVTAISLTGALSALAVVAVAMGRWRVYTDLLEALRAGVTAIYQIHFVPTTPSNPDCE